jgi:polar amino acid transport system substrate-binding protein
MISRRTFLAALPSTVLSFGGIAVSPVFAQQKTLRFGYFNDFNPLSFPKANGSMDGLLIKAVSLVCNEAGFSVQHEGLPWRRAQKYVSKGILDAFCTNPTESRKKYATFCERPLVINRTGALHKKGDTRFLNFRKKVDMQGLNLADYLGNKWIEAELGHVVTFTWVSVKRRAIMVHRSGCVSQL